MEQKGWVPVSLRKKICIGVVLVALLLAYELGMKVSPFWFHEKEVYAISISVHYFSGSVDGSISGEAHITDRDGVKEAVRTLNSIRAWRGFYSVEDLSGDSPSAMITVYESKNDTYGYYFHIIDDIIVPEADTFYKIRYEKEHKKLAELCKKYGEYREE